MSQLQLYKASAGSGKTFRLAVEYLKIALSGEWNYKHILAVTFTNKATTEMKHRVVQELYELSQGKSTAYLEVLANEMKLSEVEIAARAKQSLKHILHDYSRFSVSTIDSFFQRVIKAFNRELGINTAYQVDLEEDLILEEAVDQLLLSISDDPDLLEWLKQFARDKILEGKGWNLKNDILALGKQIYNETFKEQNEQLYQKLNDKVFIRRYKNDLQQIIFQFENKLSTIGKAGLNIIKDSGLSVADFKFGKGGAANSFNTLANGELKLGSRLLAAAEDPVNLFKMPDKKNVEPTANKLHLLLAEVVDFYQKKLSDYNTAKLISKQLYTLAILVDLQTIMRKLVREKGVVLISESGNLLKEIISDADAPFVYEKTGVFYQHFMIDEFQDTSGLQWNNFQPLINNSLSEDNISLVVGDVKQAIYRWRNGDWRLLAGKISKDFPQNGISQKVLAQNWRSDGNVIRFNNSIFQLLPKVLDNHFTTETNERFLDVTDFPSLDTIYKESVQQIGKTEHVDDGFIRMRFLRQDKTKETDHQATVLNELVEQIKKVQDVGAVANEIAILVRKKDHAKLIADRLLEEKQLVGTEYNFNVLSSESLYVKSSSLVGFIIGLLELLISPDDALALAFVNHLYYDTILPLLRDKNSEPCLNKGVVAGQLAMDFSEKYKPSASEQFEQPITEQNDFTEFLSGTFFQQELPSSNIQEIIFKICDIFNLFELKDEQAYLQAFIDQVGNFMKSRPAEVSSFLAWWELQGHKKTIAVSEDLDAIRIQTIHKAKGLEYKYVFVPFCDWAIGISSAQHAPVLWCKPDVEPFNQLELVPVKYESSMVVSAFSQAYFEEKMSAYIDNLNMLYVAFTRARTALFTWSDYTDKLNTVGDLLFKSINMSASIPLFFGEDLSFKLENHFSEEDGALEIGKLKVVGLSQKADEKAFLLKDFRFADFNKFLHLRKRNENFFLDQKTNESRINQGRIIHEVLARINTADELQAAVRELVVQGVITSDQSIVINEQLQELVNDPEISSWFNGEYRVINERSILTGNRGLKRPDRIMIGDNETIVVDYKSGEMELDKYHKQVRSYMRELSACGFNNVSGYIWYTKSNKRVKVDV